MNIDSTGEKIHDRSTEITLKDFLIKVKTWNNYLLTNWITIFFAGILGVCIGFVYAHFKVPVFTSTTTFVLEEANNTGSSAQYAGLASMVGINLNSNGGGIFQSDNLPELYKSRSMLQKALLSKVDINGKTQLLIERYIQINKLNASKESVDFFDSSKTARNWNRRQDSLIGVVVEDVRNNYLLIKKVDKNSSIVQVQIKAKDEVFAKAFNDQIVKTVSEFYVQTKTKKALNNLSILQQQTDSVRAVLNSAIYNNALVLDATPNLNVTRQVLRTSAQRSQVNSEANKAILSQLVQNLELSKIALRKETPLIQVLDQPVYPLQKSTPSKFISSIVGGVIFGFLACLYIIVKQILTFTTSAG